MRTNKRFKQRETAEDSLGAGPGGRDVYHCERCGNPMKLGAVITRYRDEPTFMVFECAACKTVTWIARDDQRPPK